MLKKNVDFFFLHSYGRSGQRMVSSFPVVAGCSVFKGFE